MERSWWGRLLVLLFVVGLGVAYVIPTVTGMDLEKTQYPIKKKINLGLDLQGGLYMVLGVDFKQVYREVVERLGTNLESRLKEKNVPVESVKLIRDDKFADDPRAEVRFPETAKTQVHDLIKEEYPNLRISGEDKGSLQIALSNSYRQEVRSRTIDQSIEVIRNRIDEFGVAEPTIASHGDDRVVVELPGIREIERAKDLIGRTAKLEFRMVDDESPEAGQLSTLIAQAEKEKNISYKGGTQKFSEYVRALNDALKGKIPEGRAVAFEKPGGEESGARIPYLLFEKTEVTGDELQDASVQTDPETNRPEVGFTFNPRGASLFDKLTGDNVGKRMAIVLDNTVVSAPVIQSRIGARGRITLGQGGYDQVLREARDLAIVLRAGALPAQLEMREQRVVGPSLGADSIRRGVLASAVGTAIVLLFTLLYYRASGVFACIALILNGIFVLAILVGLDATLTLPGIAGIALTIGMAVDSNVLIYERIREELREGKTVGGAVTAGFQKAIGTIVDSNLTTAAAGLVLLVYGTGPIKGFAVTLLIGIATTMFTAIFICRLMFDIYLRRLEARGAKTISI